jgi:hypothetical protein
MTWFNSFVEALVYTTVLFTVHGFAINEKVIEPAMARKEKWGYVAGFVYYALSLTVAVYVVRLIGSRQKK